MKPAQKRPAHRVECRELIVPQVGREVRVIARDKGHARLMRRHEAAEPHAKLRGRVNERRLPAVYDVERAPALRRGHAQLWIRPERDAGPPLDLWFGGRVRIGHRDDLHRTPARLNGTGEALQRARHAVDLRRIRIGENGKPEPRGIHATLATKRRHAARAARAARATRATRATRTATTPPARGAPSRWRSTAPPAHRPDSAPQGERARIPPARRTPEAAARASESLRRE